MRRCRTLAFALTWLVMSGAGLALHAPSSTNEHREQLNQATVPVPASLLAFAAAVDDSDADDGAVFAGSVDAFPGAAATALRRSWCGVESTATRSETKDRRPLTLVGVVVLLI